jgi:hypothetical protein
MRYHATVYYRTQTNCNTWMGTIEAADMDAALTETERFFRRRRPRAVRIDCIEVKPSQVRRMVTA